MEPEQVHSEELLEIAGSPEGRIVRKVSLVFGLLLLGLFTGSLFIQYPRVITVPVTLHGTDLPKPVVARTDGYLTRLMIREKAPVKQGQILGQIFSTASREDIAVLEKQLDSIAFLVEHRQWERLSGYPSYVAGNLGELQPAYQDFIAALETMRSNLPDGSAQQKIRSLSGELQYMSKQEEALTAQQGLYQKDIELARENFSRNEILFREKVISASEYKKEESNLLSKQLPLENVRNTILSLRRDRFNREQAIRELEEHKEQQRGLFLQSLHTMIGRLGEWSEKYELIAPVDGEVMMNQVVQEKEKIAAGQTLFFVTPVASGVYGEVKVDQANIGQLHPGQPLYISLDGYPFQEYGKLTGNISSIYRIADKDQQYLMTLNIDYRPTPEGGRKFDLRDGMTGKAEIITRKERLLSLFFYSLRKVLNHPSKGK